MSKLSPRSKALYDDAHAERELCLDWLKISRNAVDFAWIEAIERMQLYDWYEPLRRPKRETGAGRRAH